MASTQANYVDLAEALAGMLDGIDGLRPYAYINDSARPPACLIGQPEIDYTEVESGFCRASFFFPFNFIVSRNRDREAQKAMARLLHDVELALSQDPPAGIWAIEPQTARELPVSLAGQDLPGYLLIVKVRA